LRVGREGGGDLLGRGCARGIISQLSNKPIWSAPCALVWFSSQRNMSASKGVCCMSLWVAPCSVTRLALVAPSDCSCVMYACDIHTCEKALRSRSVRPSHARAGGPLVIGSAGVHPERDVGHVLQPVEVLGLRHARRDHGGRKIGRLGRQQAPECTSALSVVSDADRPQRQVGRTAL
jgi:hypothetical protein